MLHAKGLVMNDLDFAALLVSRVCHDLVSPVGAVVNGLEVLEDETDAAMRADALRLVAASAEQAAARLQFARVAFGAAGSAGAELDLSEVGRIMVGLLKGGKTELVWQAPASELAQGLGETPDECGDCRRRLPAARRQGDGGCHRGRPDAELSHRRRGDARRAFSPESERALLGEPTAALDGRSIQPYLTYQLAKGLNAGLTAMPSEGEIRLAAG